MRRCGHPTGRGTLCRRKGRGEDFRCYAHRAGGSVNAPVNGSVSVLDTCSPNVAPDPSVVLDACPICLDDVLEPEDAQLSCKHAIHVACASQMATLQCPLCRGEIMAPHGRITEEIFNAIVARQEEHYNGRRERQIGDDLAAARIISSGSVIFDATVLIERLEAIINAFSEMDGEEAAHMAQSVRNLRARISGSGI